MCNNTLGCQKGYEKCRIRSSILYLSSIVVFSAAIISVYNKIPANVFQEVFYSPSSNASTQIKDLAEANKVNNAKLEDKIVATQKKDFNDIVYTPLLIIIIIHLFRLYLSLLVIDEDPDFYDKYLRKLTPGKRVIEYLIRFVIFLSLVAIIHDLLNVKIFKTIFEPLCILYFTLLFWDFYMIIVSPLRRVGGALEYLRTHASRLSFIVSDVCGFIATFAMVYISISENVIDDVIKIALIMNLLNLIGVLSIGADLYINRQLYFRHVNLLAHLKSYSQHPCR